MDIRNELDFQFLDLHDLNDCDKNELIVMLKSNDSTDALKLPWNTIENNNDLNDSVIEVSEVENHWHHNDTEDGLLKYPPASILVPTMTTAHITAPYQIMTCDWPRPVYINNVPTEMHVPPFMSGIPYSHHGYNIGNEIHGIPITRENGRRSNRGRNMRRDNYNRAMNTTNDIQTGYMGEQGQYHPQMTPLLYIYPAPEHNISTQQHQVPAPMYHTPTMYTSPTIHTHTNTHPHPHTAYPATHHHPSENVRYVRQSQTTLGQANQDGTKLTAQKSHEKRNQNTYSTSKPSFHKINEDDNGSSQTNIVTTVIVNNSKLDSHIEAVEENNASRKSVNNNNKVQPVNVKIEHNIVSTVNENCNRTENNDVPCVNINSSIQVKQNGETDKEYKNETVSSIKTTVKTSSKSTQKIDENEIPNEESVTVKDKDISVKETNCSAGISTTPTVSSASSLSWASIVKSAPSTETQLITPLETKPTARVNPLPSNNVPEATHHKVSAYTGQKDQFISSNTNSDYSSPNMHFSTNDFKTSHSEMQQNRYDDPNAYRLGEFLVKYQIDKQTVSLLPRGLTNRSNYCYINSILQALLACPPFYNLLVALPRSKNTGKCSATPLIDNMIKFVSEFTPLSEAARLPRKDRKRGEDTVVDIQCGVAFEPSYVYTMLKNTSAAGVFSVEGRQEDAEEFLSCLLNGLNDEMLELMKLVSDDQNTTLKVELHNNYDSGEEEWKVMGPKNKGSITRCTEFGRTPLSDIFRGQLRSRVSRAGEEPTDNVQPFFTLQLDIEKAKSVKDAFEILVGRDQLEGMTCSKTKQQIKAWKQVHLEELPVVLILHLKWFDYKLDGCSKIVKSVEFPIDLKVDGNFVSPNAAKKLTAKQKQYKLFAVTYHDGKETTKGHYVTDAFHVGYGGWVRYDDSSLKGVPESNVLHPNPPRVPYLLYYRRCDTIGNNQTNSVKTR